MFLFNKIQKQTKNFNPTNRPAVEKIATLFKDNNLWTNLFFFLMTSDFATSYNELSLHRLRTLFSMETSIILTLNATYNETYVIQTLISIDTLTVWTVLRFHQCSQESELVGKRVSPLHFFCIFKHNNNHLISSFFSYACQDSDQFDATDVRGHQF